jgi:hypothetical protein
MTLDEFDTLLEQLDEAKRSHEEWCEEYSRQDVCEDRAAAYRLVVRLQGQVDAALEEERASGQ